jgi:Leucine-rich repeat (LRR) protein
MIIVLKNVSPKDDIDKVIQNNKEYIIILHLPDARYNKIINIPEGIKKLKCNSHIDVIRIPQFPENLERIDCSYLNLTKFPKLPKNLKKLIYKSNQLTSLPELPESLKYLDCSSNELTSLPELPESLKYLDCSSNELTSLPELPESIEELYCNDNQLTELPKLPEGLEYLNCRDNDFIELPELPKSLKYLDCGVTAVSKLPDINPSKNLKLYRKHHNALIDFQRHIRNYLQRKRTLKERCKITIVNNSDKIKVIELDSSIIPQELIEYLSSNDQR